MIELDEHLVSGLFETPTLRLRKVNKKYMVRKYRFLGFAWT